ncbi:MAG TPA: cadmium-translocating P-type ATPase [Candidatus Pullichristensenella excrementigallinarum]|uniref:Cd(2+)-exporting ATPase n=1 Tax=Candidatus Pullichristensenella excrementigallinarum TaxID=2840907 RepID=A0A9D1IDJ8_9FIRM|nr:cadmium-translocating P-type ATPase [Candidatus Pullichristensenella excrementigallinarum]
MTRRQKRMLVRIAISAALLIACVLAPLHGIWRLLAFLVPYVWIGWDVLWKAARNIAHGQVFDENFLMALATVGALATEEYSEAVFVMLFYQVGELFQSYAVGRSRQSISKLLEIRPDYANLEKGADLEKVDPEKVQIGDVIVIKPGERVPLDGVVLEGRSSLDTMALTGESLPRTVEEGDDVVSGCVNQSGLLRVRVTRLFGESTVAKILDLVENAGSKKARAENFITKFSRVYTPLVVIAAILLAVVPPLFTGNWSEWKRALIFLVVSCPCALVISVPLSFFGGIGGASRDGILVKGGSYLETLARAEIVVFDKTGTLTKGVFNVTAIHPDKISEAELLELAAYAENYSDHPISHSIQQAYDRPIDVARVGEVEEVAGRGVRAVIDGKVVCVGNSRFMDELGVQWHPCHHIGTTVHVEVDGLYAGHLVISDELKPDAKEAIFGLKALGIQKTVMLTGDMRAVGEKVGRDLGLDEVHAELLPADKVDQVEQLLQKKSPGGALVFVGDGINDAPVLSRADVGVAMGGMGSDAAIEAADVVFMDDKPSKLSDAIRIARKTRSIVRQNVAFALCIKLLVMLLGAVGMANMWEAVFADVGVSVLAILNAMRALQAPRK